MTEASSPRFHLAIPVRDLAAARRFYGGLLGCREGRSSDEWVDFDLGGHQLVCHCAISGPPAPSANRVDGDEVPVPHFGLALPFDEWQVLAERLTAAGAEFVIGPRVRFAGTPGEQGTFFIYDPSGNALEFKGFRDLSLLFAPF